VNHRDTVCIFIAALLRAIGMGIVAVLLAVYLAMLNWKPAAVGLLIAASFGGAAAGTAYVSLLADRFGRRRTLILLSLLEVFGALTFAFTGKAPWLFIAASAGMINGMGRPRGATYALEQAILPDLVSFRQRTSALAWYGVALETGLAFGSLLSGAPHLLRVWWDWPLASSYKAAWVAVAALYALTVPAYLAISSDVEIQGASRTGPPISEASKKKIQKIAALFAMDSFGGAMLTAPLLAFWFFRRFHAGEEWIGPLFSVAAIANAVSLPVASWLSRRIGLLNTIVFTHLPSSLFLLAIPFAPNFGWAAAFFLCRESLVQMDVPTRQSYLLAIVHREERTFASGITTLARNLSRIGGSAISGWVMSALTLSAPLFWGGGMKIFYDLALFATFRRVKPPEEMIRNGTLTE
jgi:MFS family permease